MLATFCVRQALGLILFLPLIWKCLPHARFVRTQFLTALGLLVIATLSAWDEAGGWMRAWLAASAILSFIGALVWTLDPAPGGRIVITAAICVMGATVVQLTPVEQNGSMVGIVARALDEFTSAALLGSAMTAMLVGHSYLISPGLALTPLMRMLKALFVSIALRASVALVALGLLFAAQGEMPYYWSDIWLWLPVRWLVGIVGPIVFGWMAHSAALIRSTQSATGILYVAVVCTILGELLSMLLARQTGLPL
jgi:hypothetical protein